MLTESHNTNEKMRILKENVETFPLKCKLFLCLLLSHLPNGQDLQVPKEFKKAYASYTHTFAKLANDEKLAFIWDVSEHVASCLANQKKETISVLEAMETTCEVKSSLMGFHLWEKKNFKFSHNSCRIRLMSSKKEDIVDLKNYLIRKSVSEKHAVVFEAIAKTTSDKLNKITVRFGSSSIFHQIYATVRNTIVSLFQQRLEELLRQDLKEGNIRELSRFTILTSKKITEYYNSKQALGEKLKKNKCRCTLIYNRNSTKIYRSSLSKKYFYLEQSIPKPDKIESILQHITILGCKSIPNKFVYELLESFTDKVTANYYKLDLGIKEHEFIVITERTDKEDYHQTFMKKATHFVFDISVQLIVATVKRVSESQYSLQIGLKVQCNSEKTRARLNDQVTNLLLAMAFDNQFYEKSMGALKNKSEMYFACSGNQDRNLSYQEEIREIPEEKVTTSSGRNSEDQNELNQDQRSQSGEQSFYSIGSEEQEGEVQLQPIQQQYNHQETAINYLKAKPFTNPRASGPLKRIIKHYLYEQWGKSSKGGVVCINEAVIREQNRILKLVITRIGSNVFRGNSIMNVSLPIQLFRDESSLISIGRNLTYAPILIEPFIKHDPIERMKYVAVFEISMAGLALSTKKPFNPILGETYQGEIDGCPLFVEQISHHPPITSLYFVGRGYKIYGTMKVEAHLGINKVRGVNTAQMVIEFDNGDKLQFQLPVMLINGLIFGERSIFFEDTVHIIDHANLLIAQITYNVENARKGFFNFRKSSPDFLAGEIYQVSQDCMNKFLASKKKLALRKEEEAKVVSNIEGEWNSKIFIDRVEIFDFQSQLPVKLENTACPLASDSVYRTDAIELIKGNIDAAQDQKDRLEQLQRRDKKLRQKYSNSKNKV